MKSFEVGRYERGISLIALVITIIVIIILAAIAFNSSTNTIGKANYSKFVSNISEVEQAINERMVEVKGAMLAKGSQITDGQAFNYVAKGGKTDDDFVVESRTPDYTIIEKSADIGIKLPVMRVNTPTETNVEVKYAVTKNGKVFIWPPYPSENAYNIRDKEFVDGSLVSSSGDIGITVAGITFKLQVDGNSKVENRELLDDGLSKKEFEEIASKIKVGDYVNYVPTAVQNFETDVTKTGYTKEVLSTDTTAKWRIMDINSETGKVMITTEGTVNSLTLVGELGFLHGSNELNRLCEKLYSNVEKNIVSRNMSVEDVYKLCGYAPTIIRRVAWYSYDTDDSNLLDVKVGDKMYIAKKHANSFENGVTRPRFYVWDDVQGNTHIASSEGDYVELKDKNIPVLMSAKLVENFNPSSFNPQFGEILGEGSGFVTGLRYGLPCEDHGHFDMHFVKATQLEWAFLCNTDGHTSAARYGLRPIIELSTKLLDITNTSTDGTSFSKAWNIK